MRIFGLPFVAAIVTAVSAGPLIAQEQAAGVATELVTTREISETVSVFGQFVAGRQSDVAVRVMGVADAAPLRAGDVVEAGDVLFELDTRRLRIDLEQVEASLIIAEAGVVAAEARADRLGKSLERTRSLVSNAAVSQAQLDDRAGEYAEALGNVQQAEAQVTAAQAAIRAARYDLENAVVRAPFDGTVIEVTAEVGEFVAAGASVARILESSSLEVEANVPSRLIDALESGQVMTARTDTGDDMIVELRAVLPTEFSATRTRPVRFILPDGTTRVAVGQSVSIEVPTSAPAEVIVVPKDAVIQSPAGWQVFVNQGGTATPQTVEIGRSIGSAFEVLGGLAPGDEVVVRGNERLRPGQSIAATPQTPDTGGSDNGNEG